MFFATGGNTGRRVYLSGTDFDSSCWFSVALVTDFSSTFILNCLSSFDLSKPPCLGASFALDFLSLLSHPFIQGGLIVKSSEF